MTTSERVRRKQLIREAEGYLELISLFDDRWPLDSHLRTAMADRVIECLSEVNSPLGFKPHVLFLKGQAHRVAGRLTQAANCLEQSTRLDPENLHTLLALAWCYKRVDRIELAIEALQQAITVDNESAIAHYNLACYWALTANVKQAVRYLSIAFDLDSKYRDLVGREPDFDLVRESPHFQAIVSVIV
jgi:tetratricopeptide (TPR) repeat protein